LTAWPGQPHTGRTTRNLHRGVVLHILTFSRSAVLIRHWFEIDLDDASMEHGARIEIRELTGHPHRGTESAAQLITADRPLWRADLFDRLGSDPGRFDAAHYHPRFAGVEPCARVWDPVLTAAPWDWLADQIAGLGAAPSRDGWSLDPDDAAELSGLAGQVVTIARQFGPDRCGSAVECFGLTRDVRGTVNLMISTLQAPELLNRDWVTPWVS
jgi:hypothetical protein